MPDTRKSAKEARYEELAGAKKDADCSEVKVQGGVSTEKGCCMEWKRLTRYVSHFQCGTCSYSTI